VRLCVWRLEAMSALTRKDVIAMLGELDDDVIAEIIASGATEPRGVTRAPGVPKRFNT
jgi:hypothetical protein